MNSSSEFKDKPNPSAFFQIGSCLLPQSEDKAEYKKVTYSPEETMITVIKSIASENKENFAGYYQRLKEFYCKLNETQQLQRLAELKRLCNWLNRFVPLCDRHSNPFYISRDEYPIFRPTELKWEVLKRKDDSRDNETVVCVTLVGCHVSKMSTNRSYFGTKSEKFGPDKSKQVLIPVFERLQKFGFMICIDETDCHFTIHIANEELLKQTVTELSCKEKPETFELFMEQVEQLLTSFPSPNLPAPVARICLEYFSFLGSRTQVAFVLSPYQSYDNTLIPREKEVKKEVVESDECCLCM